MPTDLINRGEKKPTPIGSTIFCGLRALDPLLQHAILAHGVGSTLITTLGGSINPQGPTSNTGIALIDSLNLSPYRLILLGMAVGSSAKHIFWQLAISQESMPEGPAAMIGVFNTVCNSANTLLFICTATTAATRLGEGPNWPGWPSTPLVVGSTLFVTGILTETIAEVQRQMFKKDASNTGKPYTGGLFSLARHVNYTGYSMWRSGFALAAGGWVWGAIVGSFFLWDFSNRAIPILDQYCGQRYADMWSDYKNKTPYKLIPFVY